MKRYLFVLLICSTLLSSAALGQTRSRRVEQSNSNVPPPSSEAAQPLKIVRARTGDTLTRVATRYKVPAALLERLNGVSADTPLETDAKVFVPEAAIEAPTSETPAPPYNTQTKGQTEPSDAEEASGTEYNSIKQDTAVQRAVPRHPIKRKATSSARKVARTQHTRHSRHTTSIKNGAPVRSNRSYINVDGERVSSPVFSASAPAGASAKCRDGSYSFSRNRRGTCSHHGGVARWL